MKKILSTTGIINRLKEQFQPSTETLHIMCLPVEFLVDIPLQKYKKGDIIDAFVAFNGDQILLSPRINPQEIMNLTSDQVYVPHKVNDTITYENTVYILAGVRNGTPFFTLA